MSRPYAAKLHELLQASYNLPNAVVDIGRIELGPSEIKDVTQRILEREHRSGVDAKAHYLLAASGFNAEQVLSDIAQIRVPSRDNEQPSGAQGGEKAISGQSAPVKEEEREDDVVPGDERGATLNGITISSGLGGPAAGAGSSATTQFGATTAAFPASGSLGAAGRPPAGNSRLARAQPRPASRVDCDLVDPDFDDYLGQQLKVDWQARKREIRELIGAPSSAKVPRWRTSERPGRRVLGALRFGEVPTFTPLMRAYGEIVTAACDSGLAMPDIVARFAAAAAASRHADGSSHGAQEAYLSDSWRALELNKPLEFLQRQYRDYIDAEINAHRQDARLGGVPSNFNKIKAFVALKYRRRDHLWDAKLTLVNKTPIWAYLYYLVRAGYLEEALQVVLERKDIFETLGSSFALYFKAWVDSPQHALSPHYAEMITSEFHQLQRHPHTDPYKLALYKVVGRCDLRKPTLPQVATTTEDWLWLQLVLSREGSEFTFADVQQAVLRVGPRHLAQDPAKYFAVLVVLRLYAEAVEFLRPHNEVHAVHFAIALVVRQASRTQGHTITTTTTTNTTKDSTTKDSTTKDSTSVGGASVGGAKVDHFDELVGHYTRLFRTALPTLAVNYLVMLAAAGDHGAAYAALQELVLSTGQYALLLGDVQTFTDRPLHGAIEDRRALLGLEDRRQYLASIAHGAAETANADGRVVDAILLYRLAEEPRRVLELVNAQLGLVLSGVPLGQPVGAALAPSFDVLQLARNVMRVDGDSIAQTPARDTCLILLAIADCLDLLAAEEWHHCLERLSQTGLLVLAPEPAVGQVRELAQQFLSYDASIARNIPNVLLMAMTCLTRLSAALRDPKHAPPPHAARIAEQHRARANNCMVYAGLIQFRMPRDVYASLTRMEAELIS